MIINHLEKNNNCSYIKVVLVITHYVDKITLLI